MLDVGFVKDNSNVQMVQFLLLIELNVVPMGMSKKNARINVLVFCLLTIALYFIGYWLIYRLEKATPLMLSVGVAALLTCYVRNIKISTLGWGWGEWKYQKMSFLIPLAFITISYAVFWLSGIGEWYNTVYLLEMKEKYNLAEWNDISVLVFHFFITATITFFLTLPSALGEEVAWRGFLVPELAKFMTFTNVALTSGFLWALFHYPLMFLGLYGNSETPIIYQLFVFGTYIMGMAMIMTYLRYKTNSLWTAVIFHASGNVFMQKFFTPLSIENTDSVWFVDEFGAIPASVVLIFAIYFWTKGRREFENYRVDESRPSLKF